LGNTLFGAFGRDFGTRDAERVMVVAITPKQWSGLLAALQLQSAIGELERALGVSFAFDEGLRFTHRDRLYPIFEQSIEALNYVEVQHCFNANAVCWGPYRTLSRGLHEDPRLSLERPLFNMLKQPSGHSYPAPGAAAQISDEERSPVRRAPYLGEHTDEVLSEVLALSSAQIGALHDAGVVSSSKVV
jgi:2-methylfumaryl-CoA isomerase